MQVVFLGVAVVVAGFIARVLLHKWQSHGIRHWYENMNPDPDTGIMAGAAPFFHHHGPVGCLLLHGFTSSPQELRDLGDYLAERDITVLCPLMPGHGTHPLDMEKVNRKDWYRASDDAYAELAAACKEVFVAGLSMGGLLTWRLGSRVETKGLISLSSIIVVTSTWSKRTLATLLSLAVGLFLPCIKKKHIGNILDKEAQKKRVAYLHTPLKSSREFLRLGTEAWDWMANLGQDKILMIQSELDPGPEAARQAAKRYLAALPETARLIWLTKSGHLITNDFEKDVVFEAVYNFIRQNSGSLSA